jgi:hypothetical protein
MRMALCHLFLSSSIFMLNIKKNAKNNHKVQCAYLSCEYQYLHAQIQMASPGQEEATSQNKKE